MSASFDELRDADKDFYLVYGETMAAWAMLERSVCDLFGRMIGLPDKRAKALFFSANSFNGRAAMAQSAVQFAKTVPEGREFLTRYIRLAKDYSLTRNQLAHDNHQLYVEWPDGGAKAPRRRIEDHVTRDGIELEQIVNAGTNFRYLSFVVPLSLGQTKLLREPSLSLALLDLMPTDPVASRIDLNAANPLGAELQHHPH